MVGPIVAACQLPVEDGAPDTNLARIRRHVTGLPADTDIAVFPEYSLTGFDTERIGECSLVREDTFGRVAALARRTDCALVVGFVERADDTLYNAVAYVPPENDGQPTVYRKRHLWGGERSVLLPGEKRVVVETPAGLTDLLTCYDLNFVEESAALTRKGVHAVFVPGAWPSTHVENWRLLLRARTLDGVRWVVGAGRTDRSARSEPGYAGNSMVVYPDGRVLSALGREQARCLATLDPAVVEHHRATVFPNGMLGDSKGERKF